MTIRTTRSTITFRGPFYLKGVDRLLPPGDYSVVTDEERIEGLSFTAYHRVSTVIFVPAASGSGIEMATIDPSDLEAAQDQDVAMHEVPPRSGCHLKMIAPERQPGPQDGVTISSGQSFRQVCCADRTTGEKTPALTFSCPASASSSRDCFSLALSPLRPPVA